MSPYLARIAFLFLLCGFSFAAEPVFASAPGPGPEVPLTLPGFTCAAPVAGAGTTCTGTLEGYPKPVAIIVPSAYHPRAHADLILHLHGFNLNNHPLSYMLQYFQYAQGLAKSGRDAILLVPLSFGQCDDFNQSLADSPEHFRAFIDHALATLQAGGLVTSPEPASIALTGHSGAYYPLGAIIQNGVYTDRIRELYLLDATYGRAEDFEKFAAEPEHRFWSAYHTYDPNMEEVNPEIMSYLHKIGAPYFVALGPEVGNEDLRKNRVGFVISDVDHDSTSIKYFAMFLGFAPSE